MLKGFKLLLTAIYFFALPYIFFQFNYILAVPFIAYIVLSINTGIFITFYLNSFLKTNLPSFLLYSSFFGLTLFTSISLFWGELGQALDFRFFVILTYLLSFISFITVCKKICTNQQRLFVTKFLPQLDIIDLLYLVSFISLVIYSIFIILNYYYLEYDNFSFWVSDSKIIYLTGFLRNTKDIISTVNYTSYYPLHSVYLYHLFGALKEQYAAFVSIYYFAIVLFLTYFTTLKKSIVIRFLVGVTLLLIYGSFVYNQDALFTSYAEAISACFIGVVSIVALKTNINNEPANLAKKIVLIIILLYAFSQIKYFFFYFAGILFITYILTIELPNLKLLLTTHNKKNTLFILLSALFFIAILTISKTHYFTSIWTYDTHDGATELAAPVTSSRIINNTFSFFVEYSTTISNILITKYNWLFLIFIIGTCLPFISPYKFTRKILFLWLMMLSIPGVLIVYFLRNQTDLTNMSIVRYTTLGIFLIPLLIQRFPIELSTFKNKSKLIFTILSLSIIITTYSILITRIPIDGNFHTGEYKDNNDLSHFYSISQRIKATIPPGKAVMVVSSHTGITLPDSATDINFEHVSNLGFAERYLRYFLFETNKNGGYLTSLKEFETILKKDKPEYLAIFIKNDYSEREKAYREFFDISDEQINEGANLILKKANYNNEGITFEKIL